MPAPADHPSQLTLDDFRQAVRQLLPPGTSVSKNPDSNIQLIIDVIAEECYDYSQQCAAAMATANPATPGAMLSEWEQAVGAGGENLVPTLTEIAVSTLAEYRELFADYHITETDPLRFGGRFGETMNSHALRVEFYAEEKRLRFGDTFGQPIKRTLGADEVRASVRRYLPAHLRMILATTNAAFLQVNGETLLVNGEPLIAC